MEKIFKLAEQDAEKLALVVFPKFILEIVRKYLRVEVEGVENIPKRGRVLVAPNHSGCTGFDAVLLGYILHRELKRIPQILTIWKFFEAVPAFAGIARKLGCVEASTQNGVEILRRKHALLLFPEGETGSFKPSSKAYRLQKFRTGFVRMALLTGAPIVPCIVVGAEETHINLGTLKLSRFVKGLMIPIPFNLIPLPAKWWIRFLPPVDLSGYSREDAENKEKMEALAARIQAEMQAALKAELARRPYVYFSEAGARRPARKRPPEAGVS